MKSPHPAIKKGLKLFFAILAVYGGVFIVDGFIRMRNGPWIVTFGSSQDNQFELTINQPGLHVSNVKITIQREAPGTVPIKPEQVEFRSPTQTLPFGRLTYTDLTFLPGVVTLDIEGHEIELLPRTLVINRQPVKWSQKNLIKLEAKDRLPEGPLPPQRQKQLGREIPAR